MVQRLPARERFQGCLLGLAIGDGLGARFQGQPAEHIRARYPTVRDLIDNPPNNELWYTDDTQMAIDVAETLNEGVLGGNHLMRLTVVEGDLLDQDVDVIVNAWNRNIIPWWLLLPQGVSGAIKRRGGYAPFRELGKKGPISLGGAVETGPGKLPYKAIIHVAGINMLWRSSEQSIRDSVRNAIRLASERGYQSIAFPLIGSGSGGGKPERVLEIMRDELARIEFAGEVRIVQFKKGPGSA